MRHVTGHEIAPAGEFTGVRLGYARGDAEKSRFARAVAADQSDVFAFVESNRRTVEHHLSAVLDGKIVRARDDCG